MRVGRSKQRANENSDRRGWSLHRFSFDFVDFGGGDAAAVRACRSITATDRCSERRFAHAARCLRVISSSSSNAAMAPWWRDDPVLDGVSVLGQLSSEFEVPVGEVANDPPIPARQRAARRRPVTRDMARPGGCDRITANATKTDMADFR